MLPPFITYQEIQVVTEKCLAIKASNLLFLFQELETGRFPRVFSKAPRCVFDTFERKKILSKTVFSELKI